VINPTLDLPLTAPKTEAAASSQTEQLLYSVGVMAYNEEANILRTLRAIIEQESRQTRPAEIIVVASGCTDRTVPLVQEFMQDQPLVRLIVQERREGKASAINLFLQQATAPILVLVGADTIPERDALERLCVHFADATVGMTGARPVPVNDQDTFTGHAVHLLWRLHDSMARRTPKLGEVVAFRNVVKAIPTDTAVDEISIQASIARQGLRMVYVPDALVYNKGPVTIRDFLKQRRRIYAGHLQVLATEHFEAPTMNARAILRALLESAPYTLSTPRQICWTTGTIALESLARLQGRHDFKHKRAHHIWQTVTSTKRVEDEQRKLRRICSTQSVIVFQLALPGSSRDTLSRKRYERATLHALRSLLPLLRQYIRKDDLLSIHGSDTLVLVLNAEKNGAELIATRLKCVIETWNTATGKGRKSVPRVRYHVVSFAEE
jgi:biofilm PGA synthesis N-glycosyltransferase PgaC